MTEALFYLGHPAHFHLFKYAIKAWRPDQVVVCIKSKDVLEKLLREEGIAYINIDEAGEKRKSGKLALLATVAARIRRLSGIVRKYRPRRLVGSTAELSVLGRLFGIPSFICFEDDLELVPGYAFLAGPLSSVLLCPQCTSAWHWEKKKLAYAGYHELAYLHPNHFTPSRERIAHLIPDEGPYFIFRFAQLNAYHDSGISGITSSVAQQLIELLEPHGRIFITSERPLEPQFEKYRIQINVLDIHHALAFADMYIGDSQTMTAEAAVLGTPALRFNDWAGRVGYLEELEHRHALTYAFLPGDAEKLYAKAKELIAMPGLKKEWARRRSAMLSGKIDLSKFLIYLLENYPASANELRDPRSHQQFR